MKPRVRIGDKLLEEIEVTNGPRQGCILAPTLFNICTSVIAEHCLDRNSSYNDGIGTLIGKSRMIVLDIHQACK